MMGRAVLGVVLASAAAFPATAHAAMRVAVMPLSAGEGISAPVASTLSGVLVAETRKVGGLSVLAQDEIAQVLSLDQRNQLMGCTDDRCRVELGSALGADRMVMGSVAKLGESWLVHLKVLDVRNVKVLAEVDRRQRGGTVDDLLDALPAMVAQLFVDEKRTADAPVGREVQAPVSARTAPVNAADEVIPAAQLPADLVVVTDGKGLFAAFGGKGSDRRVWAGDKDRLWEQRRTGYSASGADWDVVFWEPRARTRAHATLGEKDGAARLFCGKDPTPLTRLDAAATRAFIANARFHLPRWRRALSALARDDLGTYYLVDVARQEDGWAPEKDHRLYVGKKASMVAVQVDDVLQDDQLVLLTPTGRLRVDARKKEVDWTEGQVVTRLKFLDVHENAAAAYGEWSAYKGERLGTACDGRF